MSMAPIVYNSGQLENAESGNGKISMDPSVFGCTLASRAELLSLVDSVCKCYSA